MSICIDIVVRTRADATRSKLLFRALDSIQDQRGIEARPIVVVNGSDVDPETWSALQKRKGIRLHREKVGSAALSMVAGRRLVEAAYFGFLDDDDDLIANTLHKPVTWLDSQANYDAIITNGYFAAPDGTVSPLNQFTDQSISKHPALMLVENGWLVPGAFVFRTSGVPYSMFNPSWSNMEWTRLAFELCGAKKRLHFMDIPTMRYHDTPGSLSKHVRHHEAELQLLGEVKQDARLEGEARRAAGYKYLRTLHNLSMAYRRQQQWRRAWACHLRSLQWPYTFKYLAFSRKLFLPAGLFGGQSRQRNDS